MKLSAQQEHCFRALRKIYAIIIREAAKPIMKAVEGACI